ncbi:hypothetical protein ACQPZF_01415 [Actinosynnema sp. CS-041913]|uniref:hypothetical protein n=1 Tax=Actinosynnema sp. CS-041913 TaxID=3239917 RepID=UPI003D8C5456
MSIISAIKPTSGSWIRLVVWTQVVLGPAGLVAFLVSPTAGVVTGVALALVGLAANALAKASRKMDRIFAEELD